MIKGAESDQGRESAIKVGGTYSLPTGDLTLAVTVLNVRTAYGRDDAKVTPVAGSGETWVAAYRLRG